ncbi:MAG: exosortase/archaeosortase family protein [Chitinispirillaceae bacterium]|nr:exosortase/archaeosortase family protein [Chitinispirillaceae bacterium]
MKNILNKKSISTFLPLLFLAVTFITAYHASISAMLSHGITWHFLIPLMALLLAWKQSVLPAAPKTGYGSYIFGILLVLSAFFIIFTGDVTSTQALAELGIVVGLWGCVLFIGGFSLFRAFVWPLLYLLFISSLTEGAFDIFTVFFRNASAKLSFTLARIMGFSIMNIGTYLRLPTMILNVANECSGINHFISLAAISLPLAVLSQKKIWPVIVIVVSSFPIALFSNSLRVLFLIIYNYNRVEFSHGPKNILVTGVGFFIGLLMLYGLAQLLSRFVPGTDAVTGRSRRVSVKEFIYSINQKSIVSLSALLLCGFIMLSIWKIKPAEPPQLFTQTTPPLSVQTKSVQSFPGIDSLPVTDKHLILECAYGSVNRCYLLLGWYAKQEQGREMNGYHWNRLFTRTEAVTYTVNTGKKLSFNVCKLHSDTNRFHYLITYRSRNHYTADPLKLRLYLLRDALLHRSTSGTICILALPADRESKTSFTNKLLNTLLPVIDTGLK